MKHLRLMLKDKPLFRKSSSFHDFIPLVAMMPVLSGPGLQPPIVVLTHKDIKWLGWLWLSMLSESSD